MISVQPDVLREKASNFRTCEEEMENIIVKMNEMTEALCDEWQGAGSEAFRNQYLELEPQLKKAKELANDIGEQLNVIANIYEETDGSIAAQIG